MPTVIGERNIVKNETSEAVVRFLEDEFFRECEMWKSQRMGVELDDMLQGSYIRYM